jgi:hypothetical protein
LARQANSGVPNTSSRVLSQNIEVHDLARIQIERHKVLGGRETKKMSQ